MKREERVMAGRKWMRCMSGVGQRGENCNKINAGIKGITL